MCNLKYDLYICRHWSSEIETCPHECHKHGGIPFGPRKVEAHYYLCKDKVHCWLNIRYMLHTGQVNIANWTLNEDAHPKTLKKKMKEENEDDERVEEIVIENPEDAERAKAAAHMAWLQEYYPECLAWLRWEEEELKERYHFDPDNMKGSDPLGDSVGQGAMAIVRYQDQQTAGANTGYDDASYREKLRQFQDWVKWYQKTPEKQQLELEQWQVEQAQLQQAQQYAYQHHANLYQTQPGYYPYQPTLPSSSSGHYLPAPHSTPYLTAPGDYNGYNGHAGVPGVAGLLTAPPSAGKASGSKSSSSRSKDASKHGKTEKKKEKEKEDKGRMGGKEKKRR